MYDPLHSLKEGQWFKLICGASFQDMPAVYCLTLAYTLAGADCIDVAADEAVITAAKDAISAAKTLADAAARRGFKRRGLPWLMVSLNDGEDPHFRKAEFDSRYCPHDCPRPCEKICPAQAIQFADIDDGTYSPVIDRLCYGCGRCIPVCPSQLIYARSYVSRPNAIAPLIEKREIDAIEIHTKVGHLADFQRLWSAIAPYSHQLKLLAISCPDDPNVIDYLEAIAQTIAPLSIPLIWQTDGRPMSGDIGMGTTHAAIKLAKKVLMAGLPGYVQLAGGTNQYTVRKLLAARLLKDSKNKQTKNQNFPNSPSFVAGIAYGSYARSLLLPIVEKIETFNNQTINSYINNCDQINSGLSNNRELLWRAVNIADGLVSQIKTRVGNNDVREQ